MFDDSKQYENDILYEDTEEAELSDQARQQLAEEEQLIEELETDAQEDPLEEDIHEKPERKKLKQELRAKGLARLEDSARTQRDFENVIVWTGWMPIENAGSAITNSAEAETMFLLIMMRLQMNSFPRYDERCAGKVAVNDIN